MDMQEEWKDVVGYEGIYKVSNKGRIKRLNKDKGNYIKTWTSQVEAGKSLNIAGGDISKCCNKKKEDSRRIYLEICKGGVNYGM